MSNVEQGRDQLRNAILDGDADRVSSLIARGEVNVNATPSPLILAARFGEVDIMRLLLDAGADIDALDGNGESAFHAVVCKNHVAALKLLYERGARVSVVSCNGESLLKVVSHYGDDRMSVFLLDAGAPLDGLTRGDLMSLTSAPLSVAVLARLLARNVDIAALRDDRGKTLCHRVALSNIQRVSKERGAPLVRALAEAGVDLNAADVHGQVAFHYATMMCNTMVMRALIELGADINRQDPNDGNTALHSICESLFDDGSCVELILALGADIYVTNWRGQTACHVVAEVRRHYDLRVMSLCFAGGNIQDLPDRDGKTPSSIVAGRCDVLPSYGEIANARKGIAKTRLDLVRYRALQICIGLQSLRLNALQLCEILMRSFGAIGALIAFHQWWRIATTVKHFSE
jgi:ankyrin repeat protein